MSEVTRWIVIAIIASAALSWGVVSWRKRQHLERPDSNRVDLFLQKYSMLVSLIALVLAGLAQYALQINQPKFAALGYWFGVILFVSAVRQFVPVNLIGETPAPTTETLFQPDPLPMAEPILGSKPAPVASSEKIIITESQTLIGTEALPTVVPAAGKTTTVPAKTGSIPKPASVAVWSGFTQPDNILLTAHGQILVMDTAEQIIYCLNSDGQIIQQWSIPPLPEPNGRNLALSPDGRHLYITDARKGLIYTITLED